MRRPKHQGTSGENLFVGIDLHKHRWHVTIRTFDVEVFSARGRSFLLNQGAQYDSND